MTDRDLQLKFESLLRQHRKIVMKVAAIYARSEATRDRISRASRSERGFLPCGHVVSTCRANLESGSSE